MKYILLLAVVLLFVFQNFFCARYSVYTKSTKSHSSFIYTFYLGLFLGFMTFVYNDFGFSASTTTVLFALGAAASAIVYYGSLVTATQIGSYMILMISLLFGGITVPAIMDCIINRALPSKMQLIGIVLMLIAVVFYNIESSSRNKDTSDKRNKRAKIKEYICYISLFISNGMYSVFIAVQQKAESGVHEKEMLIMTFGFASLMSILVAAVIKGRKPMLEEMRIGKKAGIMLGIAAVSATLAVNALQMVLKYFPMTLVYTVNNGGNIFFSALLSYIVFKEKFSLSKVIGTGIIIASIACLCL